MAPRSEAVGGLGGGVDNYPYDASLRPETVHGLDRLRTIADRKLAAYLYALYVQADANSAKVQVVGKGRIDRVDTLRRVASRALAGELGADAHELAAYLLIDETGREQLDDASLRIFVDRLRLLRRDQV